MNSLKNLTDEELHASTLQSARVDMQSQLDTILHLMEVSQRRVYAKMGFSTIFSYTVKALGFSDPAASERVQLPTWSPTSSKKRSSR
jgi:hypothetical protein